MLGMLQLLSWLDWLQKPRFGDQDLFPLALPDIYIYIYNLNPCSKSDAFLFVSRFYEMESGAKKKLQSWFPVI